MDPTEIYNRMDALTTQFPDIIEGINLPNKTDGYGRPAMAMMVGNLAGNGTPSAAQSPQAVYLMSKARGDLGGNNITAEFKAPAAGTLNAPLSITVTDGTWRSHDPNDADASDGITEIAVPVKDIVVNLATDATGALTTTAAQLVAALNADPAASALVTASLYARQRGRGHRPGDGGAHLPGRRRHDRRADRSRRTQGQALGLPARRHGLLGRQLHGHPADARPHGLALRRARPVPAEGVPDRQGPLQQRGRRLPVLPAARA